MIPLLFTKLVIDNGWLMYRLFNAKKVLTFYYIHFIHAYVCLVTMRDMQLR